MDGEKVDKFGASEESISKNPNLSSGNNNNSPPEVEIHLFRRGTGPIDVFRSKLGGWEQDRLEVQDILDKYGFKSLFAYNSESGRGVPIRFSPRNGRSILSYADGSVVIVDGEPKVTIFQMFLSSKSQPSTNYSLQRNIHKQTYFRFLQH